MSGGSRKQDEPAGLEQALAAAGSGITIADATRPGFPLAYVNAAFERLTGYDAGDILGRNCRFLQGPDTDRSAVEALAAALRDRREARVVLRNHRKDGTPFYNELRLAPVLDADGRYVQVIGVQNDVTPVVRAQQALEAERDLSARYLVSAAETIAEQEQQLAELRVLQDALAPAELPVRPHLDLAGSVIPREPGLPGAFYLVAPGREDSTILAVGDVVGEGLQGARLATHVRSTMATFTRFSSDPLRLLELANHSLIEHTRSSTRFVRAACASYRASDGLLRWATAGHLPPLALDTGQPLGRLERVGMPLGYDLDLSGAQGEATVLPGAGVLLLGGGDGIDIARERLRELSGAEPAHVVHALRGEVADDGDDVVLLAARVTG